MILPLLSPSAAHSLCTCCFAWRLTERLVSARAARPRAAKYNEYQGFNDW